MIDLGHRCEAFGLDFGGAAGDDDLRGRTVAAGATNCLGGLADGLGSDGAGVDEDGVVKAGGGGVGADGVGLGAVEAAAQSDHGRR